MSLVTRLKQNVKLMLLGIFLLAMSSGCCSPVIPPDLRPKETLNLDKSTWDIPVTKQEDIRLPYADFRAITANRLRWVKYGIALEQGSR